MKDEKANLITQYINRLHKEVDECKNDILGLKTTHDLYDVIRETVLLFSEELPELEEKLLWKDTCVYNDANLTIGSLKKYLIDNDMIEIVDSDIQIFWNRYKAWYKTEVYSSKFIKSEFLEEDINSGEYLPYINYEQEYHAYYGSDYPLSLKYNIYNFQDVIMFIEIVYSRWITPKKKRQYSKYVNQLFAESFLPYHLKNGKILFKGYMSTDNDGILNQKMFEDKLDHSKKLILSNDKNDKKLALKLIIDCIEYLESIQQNSSKQREELAKSVSNNPESKLIIVLKNDLKSIFTMANEYFDIRHNKENTNQGDKREVVDDIADIEYIYNRIYATVQLLSIKAKEKINGKNK